MKHTIILTRLVILRLGRAYSLAGRSGHMGCQCKTLVAVCPNIPGLQLLLLLRDVLGCDLSFSHNYHHASNSAYIPCSSCSRGYTLNQSWLSAASFHIKEFLLFGHLHSSDIHQGSDSYRPYMADSCVVDHQVRKRLLSIFDLNPHQDGRDINTTWPTGYIGVIFP
jgi:hypothetical protein